MIVLVTGGAGFIGSHLCEELIKTSDEVYSIDNYSTGKVENHVEGVNYITGEVKNINNLINFVPNIIFHLGEYSRVEQSFEDVEKVWDFNINGIFSILEFCRKNNSKLVYAGSSTKFSNDGKGSGLSPYTWSKASNTNLIENYGNWYGISYAIAYFYNVYGGREIATGKYATLIAIFVDKFKKGEDLTVVLPGTQLRNFTHIDDIISGLILIGKDGHGDNYGIGCSKSYTVLEIAKAFNAPIRMLPERKGNRMNGDLKTEKTKKLGWKETKSVIDYINKIVSNN